MLFKTNIGDIPLEDYLDIKARQYGYEDYDDLRNNGLVIERQRIFYLLGRNLYEGNVYESN